MVLLRAGVQLLPDLFPLGNSLLQIGPIVVKRSRETTAFLHTDESLQ